tara:strand:+ start:110 stop:454 length:345 start_codon:yes stop_codon:yes gene_type:complete
MELEKMSCYDCKAGSPPVSADETRNLLQYIPLWERDTHTLGYLLKREFKFQTFKDAFEFTSKIADLADEQNHHPKIITEWGKVGVFWWTHTISGLHINDFIMAAKTDVIAKTME